MTAETHAEAVGLTIADLTEACLAAHRAVMQGGTQEMQSISEALLLALGHAIANDELPAEH